ncbi:hypothetical protein WOLCODRAFT_96527 [Wolfiporia cocos MD-104 SS10]|uniref:Phosphatidylinositol N-acetylglucosaminyltransferase subunit H conserved domain-containing protein n=1 Tax=Wolfiporia cocos (strain MD-104) TaxID=742152 RepID=A0A2H3J856_WOLCO|nr:hypothetical protein WOLCODRAFT_96527 [Wolfiporia cocos MD-104 SS10]
MRRDLPLLDHPELTLIECPAWLEYRVDNPRFLPDGPNGSEATVAFFWLDAFVPLVIATLWPLPSRSPGTLACLFVLLAIYLYARCTQVLWESVVILPSLGLQLETHRGPPRIPLFVSRRFIPLSTLQDFIINEGLHGWDVRYYLAAIQQSRTGAVSLEVAYENLLPRFPVLLEVYYAVHEKLLNNGSNTDVHDEYHE